MMTRAKAKPRFKTRTLPRKKVIRKKKKRLSPKLLQYVNFGSFPGIIMFTCGFTYDELVTHLAAKKNWDWLTPFKNTQWSFGKDVKGFASKQVVEHKKTKEEKIYYFICMRDPFDFDNDFDHIALAHEVIHITTYNLRDMLNIAVENEAFAYTHTHISKQIYRHLRGKVV